MKSFPFDSDVTYTESGDPIYDRASDSKDLRDYFHLMYTDGVFPNPSTGLQVVAYSEEMCVSVLPGNVLIQGAFGIEENTRTLVFEAAGTTYDRIDAVVARLNTNHDYRKIDLYVKKGVESQSPVAPELAREGGIYELRLANVFISKNTSTITTERITDTRLNTDECGIVTCNPEVIDTTAIFTQYQASLDEYMKYVKECIDGTTAGNLQNQIDELKEETEVINSNLESCFQSVSDGKALVASAITDQGIETDATATFEVMANNIRSIERIRKIDFNVFASNQEIKPIFVAPKNGYYNIYMTTSTSGTIRVYKYNGEVVLFSMDIGANQEKNATVYLNSGDTAGVWININSGAYFSGYAVIPD